MYTPNLFNYVFWTGKFLILAKTLLTAQLKSHGETSNPLRSTASLKTISLIGLKIDTSFVLTNQLVVLRWLISIGSDTELYRYYSKLTFVLFEEEKKNQESIKDVSYIEKSYLSSIN